MTCRAVKDDRNVSVMCISKISFGGMIKEHRAKLRKFTKGKERKKKKEYL